MLYKTTFVDNAQKVNAKIVHNKIKKSIEIFGN